MPEFHCQDCDATFNSLASLRAHETRSHTGDQPIDRSLGGSSFTGPR